MVVDPKITVSLQVSPEPIVIAGTEQDTAKAEVEEAPVMPKARIKTEISFWIIRVLI
jgi:hypothetical protein